MRRLFSLAIHVGVPLALVAALVLIADAHSWSDNTTQWGVAAILGGATIVDLLVSRWRENASGGPGAAQHRGILK